MSEQTADVPPRLQGLRVLVADDRPEYRVSVERLLRTWGATPTAVENGQLAIDEVDRATNAGTPYQLMLIDMQMPVLDGPAAVQQLRHRGYRIPVIALTANLRNWSRDEYLKIGCNDFVSKPVNATALLSAIVGLQPPGQ